jgi:carbonic anhydrase
MSAFLARGIGRRGLAAPRWQNMPPPSTASVSHAARYLSTAPGLHDKDLQDLLENNKKWVAKMKLQDPTFFDKLGAGQAPNYLYFGCSDSRVPANEILGLEPGTVFVHRNLGNCVGGQDLNALSVLEYAVKHLDVKHIIVTGHYDCGAVRAAASKQDLGLIENWFRMIRDVYRLHQTQLDMVQDDEERHRKLVELNVVEQCLNLYKTGVVQRKRLETYQDPSVPHAYPRIHGMVFDPKDGVLKKMPINFGRAVEKLKHVYDLYELDAKDKTGHYMLKKPTPAKGDDASEK